MADQIEKTTEVAAPIEPQETAAAGTHYREVTTATPSGPTLAARIIWYVAGVLLVLLAFRFILALLGANPGNAFANFIYTVSHPFVAPFFSLFSYDQHLGVGRFEIFTLVAMLVYALVAWGLARLATIGQSDRSTYYRHHTTRV